MNNLDGHRWIIGSSRASREAMYLTGQDRTTLCVDCHRGLRGPYSGTSELLHQLVGNLYEQIQPLVDRYSIEILTVASTLHEVVRASKATLTTLAIPTERTRFFSSRRTARLAHGLIDFLMALFSEEHLGAYTVVFENVHMADELDREFLRLLLRRAKVSRLQVVVASEAQGLDESLLQALGSYAQRVEADGVAAMERQEVVQLLGTLDAEERESWGRAYVMQDCAGEDALQRLAYESASESQRKAWHGERRAQMTEEEVARMRHGAWLLHTERGSDAKMQRLEALHQSLDHCAHTGFYHAILDIAHRGRALIGAFTEERLNDYWFFTSKLIMAFSALNMVDEAEDICMEARTLTSAAMVHMRTAYSLSMLYTRYYHKRDHLKAKAWSNLAIALADLTPDAKERAFHAVFYRNGLALVEMHMGNMERALEMVRDGHARLEQELEPHEHRLHRSVLLYNIGQILSRQQKYEEALALYEQVIEIDPNYPEYHFDRGNLLNLLGRTDEAVVSYNRALAVSPPFPEVYHNRALLYKQQGRWQEALADYDYLLDLNPDDIKVLAHRVDILCDQEVWDLARRDVEHALTIDPQHAQLLCKLGLIEMAEGNLQAAVTAFTSSLSENGSYLEAWTNRAVARYEQGDIEGAIADLTEALQLGENATVLFNRAWAYQALEKWDAAIADYSEALTLPDCDALDIYYQRGVCLLSAGREEDGLLDLKRHLELAAGASPYQEEIAQVAPTLVS